MCGHCRRWLRVNRERISKGYLRVKLILLAPNGPVSNIILCAFLYAYFYNAVDQRDIVVKSWIIRNGVEIQYPSRFYWTNGVIDLKRSKNM